MDKKELRAAVQEMNTYQFGLKNELHNKLTKVTSYIPKKEAIDLINQLDEPDHVVCAENERTTQLVEVPQFVAEYLEDKSIYSFEERIAYLIKSSDGDSFYLHELLPESSCITEDEGERLYEYVQGKEPRDLLQLINGYTIEPPETLQVIVKNYGSTVYKTELPEDEAMKLIEGWRG